MRETDAAGWKAGKKRRCDIGVKKTKRILWVCIFVLAGIIDLTVLIVNLYYARQENIFFNSKGIYSKYGVRGTSTLRLKMVQWLRVFVGLVGFVNLFLRNPHPEVKPY